MTMSLICSFILFIESSKGELIRKPHRLWSHQTKAKATRVLLLRCFWVAHLFNSVIHVNRTAPYHKLRYIPFSSFRPWPSTCLNSSHCPQYPIRRSMFQCCALYIVSFLSSWCASSLALCKQFSFVFFLCFCGWFCLPSCVFILLCVVCCTPLSQFQYYYFVCPVCIIVCVLFLLRKEFL